MHHGIRTTTGESRLDLLAARKVALDKSRPRIDCVAMAFTQIVKQCDRAAFIQQLFRAHTADATAAAADDNSHARGKCSVLRVESNAARRNRTPTVRRTPP